MSSAEAVHAPGRHTVPRPRVIDWRAFPGSGCVQEIKEQASVSIIIPAYNEAYRLPRTLENVVRYLQTKPFPFEIIVVDDHSTDGTPEILQQLQGRWRQLKVLRNDRNRGKGYSVRRGVLEAQHDYVLFTDSDLSTPITEMDRLLGTLEAGYDLAIGSRAVDPQLARAGQPRLRRLLGTLFALLTRLSLGLPYRDTQCGFKAFVRRQARPLFEAQRIEGFGFDPEVLFLAGRAGLRCAEVGVVWRHDPDSRIRLWRDGRRMLVDLLRVRWYSLRGLYDPPVA